MICDVFANDSNDFLCNRFLFYKVMNVPNALDIMPWLHNALWCVQNAILLILALILIYALLKSSALYFIIHYSAFLKYHTYI